MQIKKVIILGMDFKRKLPIPKDIKAMLPVSAEMAAIKAKNDQAIKTVFTGESDKFLLIIGPCSADLREPVLDYLGKLRRIQERVQEKIILVPRVYTNKPRTVGIGYKGMLHQPDPNQEPDMLKGLIATRSLHMEALRDYGFSCADEMLYPEDYRYLSDLLSYVTVGARSVENQQHRLVSSGIEVPVGLKNPTSGDLSVMINAIKTAQQSHTFLYRGWEVTSSGNPNAHAVLRGYTDEEGRYVSNYHYDILERLCYHLEELEIKQSAIIVDCNHGNSGKQPLEQIRIAKEVVENRHPQVKGLMIESYLEDGAQQAEEGVYGKSITDPCLGWEKTEKLILELADRL